MGKMKQHLADTVNVTWNYAGRIKDWQGEVTNAVMGLGGEAGEIVDLHKKMFFHSERDRRPELVNELGDLFYYTIKLMDLHKITLAEVLDNNKAKLRARYPDFFAQKGK